MYNAAVHIERAFGTVKFAVWLSLSKCVSMHWHIADASFAQSFLLIVLGLNTIITMVAMLTLQIIPTLGTLSNQIPAGPTAVIFSIVYQYFRLVPEAYKFRVFGVTFSDKIWVYATASQVSLPRASFAEEQIIQ